MPSRESKQIEIKKAEETKKFPGLFLRLFLFTLLCVPLALVYLIPLPQNVHLTRPPFEDFSSAPSSIKAPIPKKPQIKRPLVAIIIDDIGYDLNLDKSFIQMDSELSFAFLPYAPFTKRLAKLALEKNRDVLVHLPMEPVDKRLNPGLGVLSLDMDFDRLLSVLKKDISLVPGAIGVNNHMGSLFTSNTKKMEIIMTFLRQNRLFFIDSRTTTKTVAYNVAKKMGVPCGERTVFLDNDFSKKEIRRQLKRLLAIAQKKGEAIAIGHPHPDTLQTLYEELPKLKRHVKIVPVHKLVH